jgi:hypothetical protein
MKNREKVGRLKKYKNKDAVIKSIIHLKSQKRKREK